MSIYDDIRQKAQQTNVELTDHEVYRIAGTLRFAGAASFSNVLVQELEAFRRRSMAVDAAAESQTFQKIDASLKDGVCPRCGKTMMDVKLADYTPAKFCSGDCRIVLWQNDEEEK